MTNTIYASMGDKGNDNLKNRIAGFLNDKYHGLKNNDVVDIYFSGKEQPVLFQKLKDNHPFWEDFGSSNFDNN